MRGLPTGVTEPVSAKLYIAVALGTEQRTGLFPETLVYLHKDSPSAS